MNPDIGTLFKWIDNLHYTKCVHPVSVQEISKHGDPRALRTLTVKLHNYNLLRTEAPIHPEVQRVSDAVDISANDRNDTRLLNEVFANRVDILITEDRKILRKAEQLGIPERVFTIEAFLEKVTAENPELADYNVLAVKKELFGNLDLGDEFFDTFKEDYPGFKEWFNRKADETAYVCQSDGKITAFLYLKLEGEIEDYSPIEPRFPRKRRLKIGTFKVSLNGYKLGERFLKIVFDNAFIGKADEVYVTIFNKRPDQQRLIDLLEEYGFQQWGVKSGAAEPELVYVRNLSAQVDRENPKRTYPFISKHAPAFLVPIYPEYHTNLFPDSILRTESPSDYVENEPFRNAISKVYICRSVERNLHSGDVIVFYRTGGLYKGVVTTVGAVENVVTDIKDEDTFVRLCRKRSVFSDEELRKHWNYRPRNRPFIVNFLYVCSFPRRINLKRLIELGVIADVTSAPRGFAPLSRAKFQNIIREAQLDESIVVD
jgi:predicted nucleic acid-binding protein